MIRLQSGVARLARSGMEVLRSLSTTKPSPQLQAQKVVYNSEERVLNIQFNDGSTFRYPAELLRVESPSADTTHRHTAIAGRKFVGILQLQPLGSYALRIKFDDLHDSGLYTWAYLHELGRNKYQRIKQYLRRLKADNLSRFPGSRRARPPGTRSSQRR